MKKMKVERAHFKDRSARAEYIVNRFGAYLDGKVLDIGCDEAVVKALCPRIDFTGVDLGGNPDIRLNLEEIERLPFESSTFDCVLCTDVLEHLENLHFVFGELVRVAKRHIILSLPNNWANARRPIERGKGSFGKYGLPPQKPQDRHKWFFSLSEAADFIQAQVRHYPIDILEMSATEKPKPLVLRAVRRMRYPNQEAYLNRYAHSLWVVLGKGTDRHDSASDRR